MRSLGPMARQRRWKQGAKSKRNRQGLTRSQHQGQDPADQRMKKGAKSRSNRQSLMGSPHQGEDPVDQKMGGKGKNRQRKLLLARITQGIQRRRKCVMMPQEKRTLLSLPLETVRCVTVPREKSSKALPVNKERGTRRRRKLKLKQRRAVRAQTHIEHQTMKKQHWHRMQQD